MRRTRLTALAVLGMVAASAGFPLTPIVSPKAGQVKQTSLKREGHHLLARPKPSLHLSHGLSAAKVPGVPKKDNCLRSRFRGLSHGLSAKKVPGESKKENCLRSRLRGLTGFSLTAFRATMRAATGISLSAVYMSTLAASGVWIRQTTKFILSFLPPWLRYFVQPFLVLYYAPLFILRNLSGPQRKREFEKHEAFMEGWRQAVEIADETTSYWPLYVTEEGYFESDIPELDMTEGIMESVQIAREKEDNDALAP